MATDTSMQAYDTKDSGVSSINENSNATQINNWFYQKKALIEMKKKQFFSQMADTTSMPKHFGKTIKRYHYLPLLDDANINDQGIDADGLTTTIEQTIVINMPEVTDTGNGYVAYYAVGEGTNAGAATTAAEAAAVDVFKNLDVFVSTYADTVTALEALDPPWTIDDSITAVPESGNIYGSSKDVGTIASKIPPLTEFGGRVNRVGHSRIELQGTMEKFGFFDEYTKESLDFDTDSQLRMHVNREMLFAANEITEDALQIDLLNSAGVIRYGGDATSTGEISGEGTESLITYEDLMRLSIDLDDNRSPKHTKIITGSRMIDTKVVDSCRYMYIGSELIPMVKKMTDLHTNPAYIPAQAYGAAGTLANGEIGSVDQFRFIVVPEMLHWAGAGAAVGTNPGYRESAGAYNVYPMLAIGSESFTTIGFQTDGKSVKFKIKHVAPESATSYSFDDPYGEKGFMSIKWYYGFMVLRPERIALCKCVAEF
jgi:N4-gp56 family major capsid protein